MLERMLIKLCMQRSDLWLRIKGYEEAFVTAQGYRISEVLGELYRENTDFDPKAVRERLEDKALVYFDRIQEEVLTGDEDEAFRDCVDKLDRRRAEKRIKQIIDILEMAEGEDESVVTGLMRELADLQKYIKQGERKKE